jgi:hypothetical protein
LTLGKFVKKVDWDGAENFSEDEEEECERCGGACCDGFDFDCDGYDYDSDFDYVDFPW